jgi:hypothetical protein
MDGVRPATRCDHFFTLEIYVRCVPSRRRPYKMRTKSSLFTQ